MTDSTVDRIMSAVPRARSLTVEELARRVQGHVEGDGGALVIGVSNIEDAQFGDVVFAENARFLSQAARSRASAIVAFLDAVTPDKPLIKVANPRYAFAQILQFFMPSLDAVPGVHPSAVLGHGVRLGEGVSVGAQCAIGDGVEVGERTAVLPGCVIGAGSRIGSECVLYGNVTLYDGMVLGDRVILHSGAVIGADGFGYARVGDRVCKVPHIGIVEIGDDVEIGANSTVDRSKTGATIIGPRTKIDNLVHIAHNCKIGSDCVIVAQAGVAGSVQLGRGVTLAGQAGLKDNISVGDGAVVMAQAGVFGDIAAGERVSGYPARRHSERLRQDAAAANLPEYVRRLRALERMNAELASQNGRLEQGLRALAERAGVLPDELLPPPAVASSRSAEE